jgi:hypothetical protein
VSELRSNLVIAGHLHQHDFVFSFDGLSWLKKGQEQLFIVSTIHITKTWHNRGSGLIADTYQAIHTLLPACIWSSLHSDSSFHTYHRNHAPTSRDGACRGASYGHAPPMLKKFWKISYIVCRFGHNLKEISYMVPSSYLPTSTCCRNHQLHRVNQTLSPHKDQRHHAQVFLHNHRSIFHGHTSWDPESATIMYHVNRIYVVHYQFKAR